ncbi:MAG: hypothetical protein U1E46_10750 [Hyphomicrobiales bacterium]
MAGFSDPQIGALFLAVVAFLVIVPCHLVGLHGVAALIRAHNPKGSMREQGFRAEAGLVLLVMASLFGLHLLTNAAWGGFIAWSGALQGYRQCLFYSLENYTSLGLTRVQVDDTWRALAPLISLSGVFCLGWSTAVLVSVFNHLYSPTSGR